MWTKEKAQCHTTSCEYKSVSEYKEARLDPTQHDDKTNCSRNRKSREPSSCFHTPEMTVNQSASQTSVYPFKLKPSEKEQRIRLMYYMHTTTLGPGASIGSTVDVHGLPGIQRAEVALLKCIIYIIYVSAELLSKHKSIGHD